MRDWLILGLEYDRWANRKWEQAMAGLGIEGPAQPVMEHILFAQGRWLTRCGIEAPADADSLNRVLIELARTGDLETRVHFSNSHGVSMSPSVKEILLHVINHGTFHRGQIRGMVDPVKTSQIPDTDIIYFLPERDGEK